MGYKTTFKPSKFVLADYKKNKEFVDAVSSLERLLMDIYKDSRNGVVKRLYERTMNHYYMYGLIEEEKISLSLRDTLTKTNTNNPFPLMTIEFERKKRIFTEKRLTFPLISIYTDYFVEYPVESWDRGKWFLNTITEIVQLLRGNPVKIKEELSTGTEKTEKKEEKEQKDNLTTYRERGEDILVSVDLKEAFFSLLGVLESYYTQDVHTQLIEDEHDIERMMKIEIHDFLTLYQKLDEEKRTLYHGRYLTLLQAMKDRVTSCLLKEDEGIDLEIEKQFKVLEERYVENIEK